MDKRIKIIAYTSIVAFSLIFTGLIGYFVIYPLNIKAKFQELQRREEAEKFKLKADSIANVVELTQDSINKKIEKDSLQYIQQKESLKSVYIKKVKAYESRLADTVTDVQLNSSFSIRKMLSDSSSNLW